MLLKAVYSIFKLSPARKEEFLKVNELESLIKKCSILIPTKVLWTQVAIKWESIEKGHRVTFLL